MSVNNSQILLIAGSSRDEGNTLNVMAHLSKVLNAGFIDLSQFDISYYDYEHRNEGDDFLSIAEKMTEANLIILGTPVYWYSMSAQMKTFLDRWSDLVTIRKDLGRKLKGKQLLLLSCGSWEQAGEGFGLPIKQTAEYMTMQFAGHIHTWLTDNEVFGDETVQKRLNLLLNSIEQIIGK